MERHPDDVTTNEAIDAAFARAQAFDTFPTIVEAVYRGDAGWECSRFV